MALNFPNSPTDGQIYSDTQTGNRWVWDNANTCWKSTSTYAQTVTVSSTQPGSPTVGQLWWSQDYGRLFVYYNDGNSTQWVEANPADQTAGLVFNTANAAFGRANTALQNTTGTFAGSIAITGNTAIGASTSIPTDSSLILGSNTKFEISNPGQRRIYSLGATSSNYQLAVSGGAAVLFDRISGSDELAFETHYTGNSHAERMRITKEGYVRKTYQPAFFAHGPSSNQTLGNGGDLVMNTIVYNIGGCFNASTYRFTAPVAGIYLFAWSVFINSPTGRCSIKVNNANYNDLQLGVAGTSLTGMSQSAIIQLSAGDYVSVGDWQSLSGLQYWGSHSHFSGYFLG